LTIGNNGQLILSSDAELIYSGTNTVSADVSRHISGTQWHQISPTTTGTTTATIFQNYDPEVWLTKFDVSTQAWAYIVDEDLDDPLPVGSGYAVYGEDLPRADDFTITYSGNLRSTDLSPSLGGAGSGDHILIGNPFSSSLSVFTGATLNNATNLYGQIWVWNGSGYSTYTGGAGGNVVDGVIPVGQGFFVQANGSSPSITLDESDREFGSVGNFLKTGGLIHWNDNFGKGTYVMFKVSDGSNLSNVFVNFGESGSPEFENNYDGTIMFGDESAPQLYLVEGDLNLSIDYIKTLKEAEERIVQMNLKAGKDGEHILAANLDSLLSTRVILEDTKTGAMHEFNTGEYYAFNASTDDSPDRFLLHFMYSPTGTEDPAADEAVSSLNIYSHGKAVYVTNNNNTAHTTILMYDVMGREIYSNKTELGSLTRIPVNVNNTYLIVKIINGSEIVTQKVFIQ